MVVLWLMLVWLVFSTRRAWRSCLALCKTESQFAVLLFLSVSQFKGTVQHRHIKGYYNNSFHNKHIWRCKGISEYAIRRKHTFYTDIFNDMAAAISSRCHQYSHSLCFLPLTHTLKTVYFVYYNFTVFSVWLRMEIY